MIKGCRSTLKFHLYQIYLNKKSIPHCFSITGWQYSTVRVQRSAYCASLEIRIFLVKFLSFKFKRMKNFAKKGEYMRKFSFVFRKLLREISNFSQKWVKQKNPNKFKNDAKFCENTFRENCFCKIARKTISKKNHRVNHKKTLHV